MNARTINTLLPWIILFMLMMAAYMILSGHGLVIPREWLGTCDPSVNIWHCR